jgi:hypothetical protein
MGPRDEGAISALANAYGKDIEQVRKDVVDAAELAREEAGDPGE